jgi:hypothetical protein
MDGLVEKPNKRESKEPRRRRRGGAKLTSRGEKGEGEERDRGSRSRGGGEEKRRPRGREEKAKKRKHRGAEEKAKRRRPLQRCISQEN